MFKKTKKSLFSKGIIVVSATGILGTAFFIDGKELLFSKEEAVVVASNHPNREIKVENIVVSESRKIEKPFTYENDHGYDFNLDDSPTFVRAKESDNWAEKGLKSLGRLAVGKEMNVSLKSFYLIGYDMTKILEQDLLFDEKTGTLYVDIPQFEIMYKPLFEIADVDSFIGGFRLPYTEQERLDIYNEAVDYGYNLVIMDPLVQEETIETMQDSLKKRFSDAKDIKGKIKKVKINFAGDYVKVEEDVLQQFSKDNK